MKTRDHDRFWDLYERHVRQAIERACQRTSATLTDSTMDIDDMIAWVDTKVWRMLSNESYPTFHDNPTPEDAIERLKTHSTTLSRWAYLALCRKHFRQLNRRNEYISGLSQSQKLAMTSAVDTTIENRAELDQSINKLRETLTAKEKQNFAASYINKSERQRIAMIIGAIRREDDRMITKATGGGMNENTVQQMRSRARRRAAEILKNARKLPFYLVASLVILSISLSPTQARAGEQTGGRKGSMTAQMDPQPIPGEQSGGRRP
jgi:hypothetical protein